MLGNVHQLVSDSAKIQTKKNTMHFLSMTLQISMISFTSLSKVMQKHCTFSLNSHDCFDVEKIGLVYGICFFVP
jgi:hypothetical protein